MDVREAVAALEQLDPVLVGMALSVMGAAHPTVVAARAGLEITDRRTALREWSQDISTEPIWRACAARMQG
jgi:hypothetical protein